MANQVSGAKELQMHQKGYLLLFVTTVTICNRNCFAKAFRAPFSSQMMTGDDNAGIKLNSKQGQETHCNH